MLVFLYERNQEHELLALGLRPPDLVDPAQGSLVFLGRGNRAVGVEVHPYINFTGRGIR